MVACASQALHANYFIEKAAQKFWFISCPSIIADWGSLSANISNEGAVTRLTGFTPLKKTLLKSRLMIVVWLSPFPTVNTSGMSRLYRD